MKKNVIPTVYEALQIEAATKKATEPLFADINKLKDQALDLQFSNTNKDVELEEKDRMREELIKAYKKTLFETRELAYSKVFPYLVTYEKKENPLFGGIGVARSQEQVAQLINENITGERTDFVPKAKDMGLVSQQDISKILKETDRFEKKLKEGTIVIKRTDVSDKLEYKYFLHSSLFGEVQTEAPSNFVETNK